MRRLCIRSAGSVHQFFFWMFVLSALAGCGSDRSVPGGTPGVLRSSTAGIRDVQVHVHRAGDQQAVGFGITGEGGTFALYQTRAAGPLKLPPGDYLLTLESVGPEPIVLPPSCLKLQTTPLRVRWSGSERTLELTLPDR